MIRKKPGGLYYEPKWRKFTFKCWMCGDEFYTVYKGYRRKCLACAHRNPIGSVKLFNALNLVLDEEM